MFKGALIRCVCGRMFLRTTASDIVGVMDGERCFEDLNCGWWTWIKGLPTAIRVAVNDNVC